MVVIHPSLETCAFETGSFFVYLFSWVESHPERYPPSVGGEGLLQRLERVVGESIRSGNNQKGLGGYITPAAWGSLVL